MKEIRQIFERIAEHHEIPMRLGSRCEASVFYRVEDLTIDELEICAQFLSDRVIKVCQPTLPEMLIKLPGGYTELTEELAKQLASANESLRIVTWDEIERSNGKGSIAKGASVVLVNDVITTARSCLEAHTRITVMGASVLCWVALIDRTFGPGPVPVITAYTGAPVRLLE